MFIRYMTSMSSGFFDWGRTVRIRTATSDIISTLDRRVTSYFCKLLIYSLLFTSPAKVPEGVFDFGLGFGGYCR